MIEPDRHVEVLVDKTVRFLRLRQHQHGRKAQAIAKATTARVTAADGPRGQRQAAVIDLPAFGPASSLRRDRPLGGMRRMKRARGILTEWMRVDIAAINQHPVKHRGRQSIPAAKRVAVIVQT